MIMSDPFASGFGIIPPTDSRRDRRLTSVPEGLTHVRKQLHTNTSSLEHVHVLHNATLKWHPSVGQPEYHDSRPTEYIAVDYRSDPADCMDICLYGAQV